MTTVRHIARAAGSTASTVPAYHVEIQVGGHRLDADEAAAEGGGDVGPTPFGLYLSGLVACTAITLRMYAERRGWNLASLEVDVRYDVSDDGNAVVQRTITVPDDLPADQRDRLAEIAEKTPVTLAVRAGTPITTTMRAGT